MEITTKMKLVPFRTPDRVTVARPPGTRDEGFKPPIEVMLKELDDDTLSQLCLHFAIDVFNKAGKNPPTHLVFQTEE